jgi:putative ABC transport system permease protein
VRSIPGVDRADNLIVWFSLMRLPNGAREQVEIYGLEDFERWHFPWKTTGIRGDLRRGHYMLLDDSARARFGDFGIGDFREIGGRRMKIIGVSHDALSFTTTPLVFMRLGLAQGLDSSLLNQTTYIIVKVAKGNDVLAVRDEIARRLPNNDVYLKDQWVQRTRDYWMDSTGLGLNMIVGVLLGALVGVAIVVQTLYSSTMEHLREFGTVKAIGGSNADIYRIIAKQATLAALAGFAGGVPSALAVGAVVSKLGLKLMIPAGLYVVVLVGAVVLCLIAGMLSFFKVASIDPAMVFRN